MHRLLLRQADLKKVREALAEKEKAYKQLEVRCGCMCGWFCLRNAKGVAWCRCCQARGVLRGQADHRPCAKTIADREKTIAEREKTIADLEVLANRDHMD